jgi:hypothetical protein
MNRKNKKTVTFYDIFNNPSVLNIKFGARAIGAASRYASAPALAPAPAPAPASPK